MTTIEMYEKKKSIPWRYDYGKHKNFAEVRGNYRRVVYHLLAHVRLAVSSLPVALAPAFQHDRAKAARRPLCWL